MPWLARIRSSKARDDVVRVAREYVAQLSASELELLPQECLTGVMTEAYIQQCAWALARHHGHGDNARIVHKLGEFFSSAAVRLAELATP
jgi:hypothetical protein